MTTNPLDARCPECHADKGEKCISAALYEWNGPGGDITRRPHRARIAAAEEVQLTLFITTQGEHDNG